MQSVPGWISQIVQSRCKIQILKLAWCSPAEVQWKIFGFAGGIESLSPPICERPDHRDNVMRNVTDVKQKSACHERLRALIQITQRPKRNLPKPTTTPPVWFAQLRSLVIRSEVLPHSGLRTDSPARQGGEGIAA